MKLVWRLRYGALAVLVLTFGLTRLAFASGPSSCQLTLVYPTKVVPLWPGITVIKVAPGDFECIDKGCQATCPSEPTTNVYEIEDEDGDGEPDELEVYTCFCSNGNDAPTSSGGQYCSGLGHRYIFSGGNGGNGDSGEFTVIICVRRGCPSECIKKNSGLTTPYREEWCECP